MLNISHVDHLNLNVSNLNDSVRFYQNLFGFKVFEQGQSSNNNPYKIIGLPNSLFLCLYENKSAVQSGSLNHVGIHIMGDFEKAREDLEAIGVGVEYGGMVEYPDSRSLYISDPDGNKIELSEVFGGGLGQAN
jgi:catechol 2,3-dioxygenase-like lactoylglutathione lyase family enzyme